MDFTSDSLATGRSFRTSNVVDDFTRECVAIEVDTSISGERVGRVLDRVIERRGLPKTLIVDNGPEFASRALDAWAYLRGIQLDFIRPGRPVENYFVESFNGKFRDECLSANWLTDLGDARPRIEAAPGLRPGTAAPIAGRPTPKGARNAAGTPAASGGLRSRRK